MLKLVARDEKNIVYSMGNPRELSDKQLKSLDWPQSVPRIKVLLGKKIKGINSCLRENISCKYGVRTVYAMELKRLRAPRPARLDRSVKLIPYADPLEARALLVNTQSRYYLAPWSDHIDHVYLRALADFMKDVLPRTVSARLEMGGRPIGLVTVYKQDADTDQIAWIWVESSLTGPQRKNAHYQLLRWLKESKAKKVVSVVHSFNERSSRFFERLGFRPTHIWVTRFS